VRGAAVRRPGRTPRATPRTSELSFPQHEIALLPDAEQLHPVQVLDAADMAVLNPGLLGEVTHLDDAAPGGAERAARPRRSRARSPGTRRAADALRAEVSGYFKGGVAEADEIVDQVTAQAELVAELLEGG
jgi:hypothetical protein